MTILFLDNFRGFSNTYIPIQDVNFFVGENSTGKTSVIGLLKLLSTPEFWFANAFNTEEVNFGHCDDIVSITSNDRSYFSVGYIQIDEGSHKKQEKTVNAFLMTYVERDGVPTPAFYAYYNS